VASQPLEYENHERVRRSAILVLAFDFGESVFDDVRDGARRPKALERQRARIERVHLCKLGDEVVRYALPLCRVLEQ